MNTVKCKFCGAPIVWLKTQNGRPMPCDAQAVKYQNNYKGKDLIVTPEGKVIRASVVKTGGMLNPIMGGTLDPIVDGEGYISHFATCTHSNEARKTKPAKPATTKTTTTAAPAQQPAPCYPDPDANECYADLYEKDEATASKGASIWW